MSQAMKIAIVDDERDMRQSISQWLALSGYDTQSFASATCESNTWKNLVLILCADLVLHLSVL